MQWSPDVLEEIWTHVRHDTGMWRARMRKRLWAEVHKELDDEWRSWRPDGIIETYFTNYPLPYTIVTNENDFMGDPPSDPGDMGNVYPSEIYDNPELRYSYKELEDIDGPVPFSYSYSGWCV